MKVHPIAELFPMMSEEELVDLAEDIKANGQVNPIIVATINDVETLIDGRNRLRACEIAGIEPWKEQMNGADPVALIFSLNDKRRHLSKGQRAIVVAKAYPEPESRGRGNKSKLNLDFSSMTLSQARTVLRFTPDLADQVLFQNLSLTDAYAEARKLRAAAETNAEKIEQLRQEAPDLADLSGISLDDAIKTLEQRKVDAAKIATIEDSAPDLVKRVHDGKLSVEEALIIQHRREEESIAARRGSTSCLFEIVKMIDVSGDPKECAARLMANVDRQLWPAAEEELSAAKLQSCADMLQACADYLARQGKEK